MIVEVAQATMKNWTPSRKVAAIEGVYLEIYPELKRGCVTTCAGGLCRSRCGRKHRSDGDLLRRRTEKVDEGREMSWRKTNKEGFVVPLFTLGGHGWKMRRGDQVKLVADVYRSIIGEEDNKVCSLFGHFRVGAWGECRLVSEDKEASSAPELGGRRDYEGVNSNSSSDEEEEDEEATSRGAAELPGPRRLEASSRSSLEGIEELPALTLDLRPVSSRPFSLEHARPREASWESLEMIFAQKVLSRRPSTRSALQRQSLAMLHLNNARGSQASWGVRRDTRSSMMTGVQELEQQDAVPKSFVPSVLGTLFQRVSGGRSTARSTTAAQGQETATGGPLTDGCVGLGKDRSSGASQATGLKSLLEELGREARCESTWSEDVPRSPSLGGRLSWGSNCTPQHSMQSGRSGRTLSGPRSDLHDESRGSGQSQLEGAGARRGMSMRIRCRLSLPRLTGSRLSRSSQGSDRYEADDLKQKPSVRFETSQASSLRENENVLGELAENLRRKAEDNTPYNNWIPSDWQELWKSPWPSKLEGNDARSEVTPLMEAEFRKDCIIFFNTLFPRAHSETFKTLRDLALDPGSKLQFRLVARTAGQADEKPHSWSFASLVALKKSTNSSARSSNRTARFSGVSAILARSLLGGVFGRTPSSASSSSLCGRQDTGQTTESRSFSASWGTLLASRPAVRACGRAPECGGDTAFIDPELDVLGQTRNEGLGSTRFPERFPHETAPRVEKFWEEVNEGLNDNSNTQLVLRKLSDGPSPDTWIIATHHGVFLDEYSPRILLLKRLLVCFALCGVYYTEVPNSAQIGDLWPYPIASVLGHGSRVLVRLEEVEGYEFLNFLLTGDPGSVDWREQGIPPPLKSRIAASHSVQMEMETGNLIERKLRVMNAADSVQNITDGIRKKHLGVNLPIGGVGNPSPMGDGAHIEFTGRVVRKEATTQVLRKPVLGKRFSSSKFGKDQRQSTSGSINKQPSSSTNSSVEEDGTHTSPRSMDPSWRPLPNIQGGHLYIRVDDFGVSASRWSRSPEGVEGGKRNDVIRRRLQTKQKKDTVPLEQAKLRVTLDVRGNDAGDLFFPKEVPQISARSQGMTLTSVGPGRGPSRQLCRMCSEPAISKCQEAEPSAEDVRWFNQMKVMATGVNFPVPPSPTALKLLLQYYDPLHVQLFGTAQFKSIEEFQKELSERKSFLLKRGTGVQRYVEPAVLQLWFKGHVLMLTHERADDKEYSVQKNTFLGARAMPDEPWVKAVMRTVVDELNLPEEKFILSLRQDTENHRVVEETMVSPSYPGMFTFYRTHLVEWEIREDQMSTYIDHGLPIDTEKRVLNPHNSDFVTTKLGGKVPKRLFWNWVPEAEARRMQRFANMGEATADERWAKYAFQKEGIVQFPHTEAALELLFQRCGLDTTKFGQGAYKSMTDLWIELMNQDTYLQMVSGRPQRVVEMTYVKIRHREKSCYPWQVLVQTREEPPDSPPKTAPSLVRTRKRKEETWDQSALRSCCERLVLSNSQVKSLLDHKPNDASAYTFYEEAKESESYPGVSTVYRTHLVTYTLREHCFDYSDHGRSLLGSEERVDRTTVLDGMLLKGFAKRMKGEESLMVGESIRDQADDGEGGFSQQLTPAGGLDMREFDVDDEVLGCHRCMKPGMGFENYLQGSLFPGRMVVRVAPAAAGYKRNVFMWYPIGNLDGVRGASLWQEALKMEERVQVSSVLIGLEGSEPLCRSPFGVDHDPSGTSAAISALGGQKWRSYRSNAALQIPANEGGMRMKVDRRVFEVYPRDLLDQRFSEMEMFKALLAGSGVQAKRAVEQLQEHRLLHRPRGKIYHQIAHGRRPRRFK